MIECQPGGIGMDCYGGEIRREADWTNVAG